MSREQIAFAADLALEHSLVIYKQIAAQVEAFEGGALCENGGHHVRVVVLCVIDVPAEDKGGELRPREAKVREVHGRGELEGAQAGEEGRELDGRAGPGVLVHDEDEELGEAREGDGDEERVDGPALVGGEPDEDAAYCSRQVQDCEGEREHLHASTQ